MIAMRSLVELACLLIVLCQGSFAYSVQNPILDGAGDRGPITYKNQLDREDLSDVIASSPLLSLHRALCEIESITNNEYGVGKLVVSILEAHNFTVTKQYVPPATDSQDTPDSKSRFNIYAVPNAKKWAARINEETESQNPPKVLLTSHIDTVPPHIPYSFSASKDSSRKDIFIAGRGTVDDKACVAAQIQTVLELLSEEKKTVKPADLALLFVVGEETVGDGMKHFSDSKLYRETKKDYKAVLFGEPTELKLASGHKGIMSLIINAMGKAAHSGYPWLGRSANSMILPALMVMDKLGDIPEEEGGLPRSEKYGKTTVNVGLMQGGIAANVVPEHAMAKIAMRLAGGTVEQVQEVVKKAIHAVDPDDLLNLTFTQGYGPVSLDADVSGFDSITVNYGTDVPNLELAEGVKRYLYGPGSILVAHGKDEGLTVGDLEEAVKGYKKLVLHALQS